MKKFVVIFMLIFLCFSLFAVSSNKALDEWNKLSEDEKWLCLLTEPFLGTKNMSLATVNPEPKNKGKKSRDFLENGWKLYSKQDVLNLVYKHKMGAWGENPGFMEAKAFYEKYPNSSLDEIATIECLGVGKILRLYYYAENKDKIGVHGLLALDSVRILSVLRWSVAAGWFTEEEAVETAKPLMTQLLNAYDSWEDFAVHFALGWYCYDMYYCYDLSEYQKGLVAERKKYDGLSASRKTISHDIKFPAENLNGSRILTYDDMFYAPSEDAEMWCLIWNWNHGNKLTYAEKEKLKKAREAKADIPGMAYLEILECAYGNEDLMHIEDYIKIIDKARYRTDLYHKSYIWYGMSIFVKFTYNTSDMQSDQLLSVLERLEKEKSWYYLNGVYNTLRLCEIVFAEKTLDDIDRIIVNTENYAKEAIESFNNGKRKFTVTGDLAEAVYLMNSFSKLYLFDIYSDCTYVYYEARDLENALFYMKKAEENLAVLREVGADFFNIEEVDDNVRFYEKKLDEVRSFILDRYNEDIEKDNKNTNDPKLNAA